MNRERLHTVIRQFQNTFLTYFSALTPYDLQAILAGQSETLLHVLQERYGYTQAQAKAAWNEFILHHVDGHTIEEGWGS